MASLLLIPSTGHLPLLQDTVPLLLESLDHEGEDVVLVYSLNGKEAPGGADWLASLATPSRVRLFALVSPDPLSFAQAVNLPLGGLRIDSEKGEVAFVEEAGETLFEVVVVMNDDLRVGPGFLSGLRRALHSSYLHSLSDPVDAQGGSPFHPVSDYGPVGIAGPASDVVAGTQRTPGGRPPKMPLADFVRDFAARNPANVMNADFLSGLCLAFTAKAFSSLLLPGEVPALYDPRYPIGGYEDNDLMVRAEALGIRRVIAGDVFVEHLGHRSLDRLYPQHARGLANRPLYLTLQAASTPRLEECLFATVFATPRTANEFHLLKMQLVALAPLVDGIALVWGRNPATAFEGPDAEVGLRACSPADLRLLEAARHPEVETAIRQLLLYTPGWIREIHPVLAKSDLLLGIDVNPPGASPAAGWDRAQQLALLGGATWILAARTGWLPEMRLHLEHLLRLTAHPDPLIQAWRFGVVEHWGSPDLVRADILQGEVCFYRVAPSPRKITRPHLCTPDFDPMVVREAPCRWRDFRHIRALDRRDLQGQENYQVPVEPWTGEGGISLTMLVHSGEALRDLARQLDELYGLVEEIVLVWTDPAGEAHPAFAAFAELAALFGVTWVFHPFADDLSACRNAGLDRLQALQAEKHRTFTAHASPPPPAWVLVMDPDEVVADPGQLHRTLREYQRDAFHACVLFSFQNLRPASTGEPPTFSQAIRFFRLAPDWRYSSRVHEMFDRTMHTRRAEGREPWTRQLPKEILLLNPGGANDPEKMEAKVQRYTRMLRKELEDNPWNAGAWVSLGLQYENEQDHERALECFHRARSAAPALGNWMAEKELAVYHIRRAQEALARLLQTIPPQHEYAGVARNLAEYLAQQVPPMPLLGRALLGEFKDLGDPPPAPTPETLPPWLEYRRDRC